MRLLPIILFALFFNTENSFAQGVTFQWTRGFGAQANDYGKAVATDNAGNVYFLGDFNGTVDFDPGPGVYNLTAVGSADIFLLKLDANGNMVWAKTIGGTIVDQGISLALDNAGNVYYAGLFTGTVDFDPGPGVYNLSSGAPNASGVFISKLDANGNFLWADTFGSENNLLEIKVDGSGDVYATGGFDGISDFDPGPGIFNLTESAFTGIVTLVQDVYVLKLDTDGQFQWVKQMGGSQLDQAWGIALDGAGNIYTTGHFSGTADFDPGTGVYNLVANSLANIFISKLDKDGNFVWAKAIGGTNENYARDIAVSNSGDVYITGNFIGNTDFDPGAGTFIINNFSGAGDIYVLKLATDGSFDWAKQMGGTGDDAGNALALDAAGNVYVTGSFSGTADFDPGAGTYNLNSKGYGDCFISKLDANGNFVFGVGMGSASNYDYGMDIFIDPSENVYTTGQFWGTVDFDPGPDEYNLTTLDYGDAFIQKLSQCPNVTHSNLDITTCVKPYLLNTMSYNQSGDYTQVLQNVAGCDSIIHLHLIIGGALSAFSQSACDSFIWHGKTYLQTGIYNDTIADQYGCDSIISMSLAVGHTIHYSYSTSICEGTNEAGHTLAGVYIDTFATSGGCDSIRTLTLSVKPRIYSSYNASVCAGEIFSGYSVTGIYTDTFHALNGCDSIRTIHLTVHPKSGSTRNVSICQGQTFFAGGSYQASGGSYTDTLKSIYGCDSIVQTALTVISLPAPNLGTNRNFCIGQPITLMPGLFTTYNWQDGSSGSQYKVEITGTYWVSVTDANNCSASDTIQIATAVLPPSGFLSSTDSICTYSSLQLTSSGSFSTYKWSTGSTEPFIVIHDPGQYKLTVKDASQCTATETIEVVQKNNCNSGVFIPTAFTPNGDGKNDVFRALVYGNAIHFRLNVYNRWGKLVFSSHDPMQAWDGKVKGLDADTNVFVWFCTYELEGSKPASQKGTVTLIR